MAQEETVEKKVILVTGGSRGIGLETCVEIKKRFPKFAVYGTIRSDSQDSIDSLKISVGNTFHA